MYRRVIFSLHKTSTKIFEGNKILRFVLNTKKFKFSEVFIIIELLLLQAVNKNCRTVC